MQTQATEIENNFDTVLTRPTRYFIVALAIVQAVVLYGLAQGLERDWWWLTSLSVSFPLFTLVLTVPAMLMLTIRSINQRLLWWSSAGFLVFFLALSWLATLLANPTSFSDNTHVLMPFALLVAASAFILTAFWQVWLQQPQKWYPELFSQAWQNALTLLLMLVFVGIGWALISLCISLFRLLSIEFFAEFFRAEPVRYATTGLLIGFGILIGRNEPKPIQMTRKIVFAVFTWLLPVLALIVLLFVIALPFGFAELWSGERSVFSVAFLLAFLIGAFLLFFNAVYQTGESPLPYPYWLRWVVRLATLSLPILAAIALAAMITRIGEYGWTPPRYWALVLVLVLSAHAIGYAYSAIRQNGGELQLIPRVNVLMAALLVAVVTLSHLPGINPYTLSAQSQAQRLARDLANMPSADLTWLRFEVGKPGVQALQDLSAQASAANEAEQVETITALLNREQRYWYQAQERQAEGEVNWDDVQQVVEWRSTSDDVIPQSLLVTVHQSNINVLECVRDGASCYGFELMMTEVDRAILLCVDRTWFYGVTCALAVQDAGSANGDEWEIVLTRFLPRSDDLIRALRQGQIELTRPCLPNVEIGGEILSLSTYRCG
ncbi:DUF4153 domain-containing protein [Aliidiomarina haloalkalitolerans]|uniref:DUF4153 domain-containing protein n=1 Tax=Aliidiomarina haloalkalitolerans TaxID=859059 RepID=A0A432VW99_9GAMM|nr:DUF4153 domain-containing protein [Aliidiomarina haloalkalitolerans]RUO20731.1 hypothetical protein CWE06_05355 [Aliidiomarina haloalkalitolerans]